MGLLTSFLRPRPVRFSNRSTLSYIRSLPSKRPFLSLGYKDVARSHWISNGYFPRFAVKPSVPLRLSSKSQNSLMDGRTWHPLGAGRPLAAFAPSAARIVSPLYPDPSRRDIDRALRPGPFSRQVQHRLANSAQLAFSTPSRLWICLQRQARREIMNAFGFAGKRGFNPPHFTHYSRIKC